MNLRGGFSVPREFMTGFPHFSKVRFTGKFPIAEIDFFDERFPGDLNLLAFNPFIPGNDFDSSIPAAFFSLTVKNTTSEQLRYTIASAVAIPAAPGKNQSKFGNSKGYSLLHLTDHKTPKSAFEYGDICVATDAEAVSFQEYWFRGIWFDNLSKYWHDFSSFGPLKNRTYLENEIPYSKSDTPQDHALLAGHVEVKPGETRTIRFIISWNYPNMTDYWHRSIVGHGSRSTDQGIEKNGPEMWKNYYATVFADSRESATYSLSNWSKLYETTVLFQDALFSSTLPGEVLDAVSGNISILKSPTVLRLEDGSFYGFEGLKLDEGCCEGSCTHVWNYAYALPFLFPQLERSMRDLDYQYNFGVDGDMSFRLQLPLGSERQQFRPCADGQFGSIIKMYREWKISGDSAWLRFHWEKIKKNIEFAWSSNNLDRWDRDKDGILEGRQHHTLDMELFGPNSWLTGFYLCALKAAAEIAEYFGEIATANEYRALFKQGKTWADKNLFNGEYYFHKIDIRDKQILDPYISTDSKETYGDGRSRTTQYWDPEYQELKYQVADGCGIDQVLAQWHANLVGLGEVFDPVQVKSGLRSIYRYNFKSMREHVNPARIYALNDEKGLLICTYPDKKPGLPITYGEEAMNGYEYQAACHMIQIGMIDEGLEIVRAIRDRYRGVNRNPWNEVECGYNYARSMASYALLISLSGFEYDMTCGHIGFNPKTEQKQFRCFFSLGKVWGTIQIEEASVRLDVLWGGIQLQSFSCSKFGSMQAGRILLGKKELKFSQSGKNIKFNEELNVIAGQTIAAIL